MKMEQLTAFELAKQKRDAMEQDARIEHLRAMVDKMIVEEALMMTNKKKLVIETILYPVVVTTACIGAVITVTKLFL